MQANLNTLTSDTTEKLFKKSHLKKVKFNIIIKLHMNMTLHLFHSVCSKLIDSSLAYTLC